jgi:uncharacterized repeat protein (TIGR01451 family)
MSGLALGAGASGSARAAFVPTPVTADLSININHVDPFTVGRPGAYGITVTNNASPPAGAIGIRVSDTLPTGLRFRTYVGVGWTCAAAGQIVTCTYAPPLAVGATAGVALGVDVLADAAPRVTNAATVRGTFTDPTLANNIANDLTNVRPAADLSVGQTGSPNPVPAGNTLTYTVQVRNNGLSPATNVVLQDVLAGAVLSIAPSQGLCRAVSGTVSCTLGNMAAGALATVTIRSRAPSTSGVITSTARVSAAEFDPVTVNNTAVTQTTVV